MGLITIKCANCDEEADKPKGEVNRSNKLGRPLFCGRRCAALFNNAPRKAKEIILTCPCGQRFKTTTAAKAAKHCSASCASRFSMTEERREAQRQGGHDQIDNLLTPQETLKRREAWKYAALREVLGSRPHEFEYKLGRYVFDLALLDTKVLVEFDGPYHEGANQKKTDEKKEKAAERAGFAIVRRQVLPATVIDPRTITRL
jgi:very-short-patch-repair endonuclease